MRILVFSFYYPPDLSAGSFRVAAFVKALKQHLAASDHIEIVTTLPNRYCSFQKESQAVESQGNVTITRLRVPAHKSGFYDQVRSFFAFFKQAFQHVRAKRYDIVFASSSRLFTAFLAAVIAKQKEIPLYLDIRDIFLENMETILKSPLLRLSLPLFRFAEKFTINQAAKVNLVSSGFAAYFQRKYFKPFSFFQNGIDDEFSSFSPNGPQCQAGIKKRFLYAGNIGEGQGLEKIVPLIAKSYPNVEFQIFGDGGKKKIFEESARGLANITLYPPVDRKELMSRYKEADILFLHLNNYAPFERVLPSKLFEYAATFKPIVAGVSGYAKFFLEEHVPDALVFKPCDFEDFSKKFEQFSANVDVDKRKKFISRFSRQRIMEEMAQDFLALVKF